MKKKELCIVCGRDKIFEGEGRYIDGSWKEDKEVAKFGRKKLWVCCYNCYFSTKKITYEKIPPVG